MEVKDRYRYNYKTKEWDRLIRFNTDVAFVSNFMRPDGTYNTYSLPRGSWLTEHLRKHSEFR